MYQSLIHRRQSRRLNGYDYSKAGAYFITICTADKQPFFGTIKSGELCSTTTAIIAKNVWEQIPIQFPFVELDEFVVMPDHIHGILIINEPVGARLIAPLQGPDQKTGGFAGHHNPMLHQNLSRIVRWYKGRCTFEIRKTDASFEWQRNYHDHIIRNSEAYERICQYIRDNPKNHPSNSPDSSP
jgi:REP element-mobilizing transposase RayT